MSGEVVGPAIGVGPHALVVVVRGAELALQRVFLSRGRLHQPAHVTPEGATMARTASGAEPAISAAQAWAVARTSSSGARRWHNPIATASSPPMRRPV
jgi:hypothetical protein